jgi:hypothetical protein
MRRLTRLILALYSSQVRHRYGQEIADLLANSPTQYATSPTSPGAR